MKLNNKAKSITEWENPLSEEINLSEFGDLDRGSLVTETAFDVESIVDPATGESLRVDSDGMVIGVIEK